MSISTRSFDIYALARVHSQRSCDLQLRVTQETLSIPFSLKNSQCLQDKSKRCGSSEVLRPISSAPSRASSTPRSSSLHYPLGADTPLPSAFLAIQQTSLEHPCESRPANLSNNHIATWQCRNVQGRSYRAPKSIRPVMTNSFLPPFRTPVLLVDVEPRRRRSSSATLLSKGYSIMRSRRSPPGVFLRSLEVPQRESSPASTSPEHASHRRPPSCERTNWFGGDPW